MLKAAGNQYPIHIDDPTTITATTELLTDVAADGCWMLGPRMVARVACAIGREFRSVPLDTITVHDQLTAELRYVDRTSYCLEFVVGGPQLRRLHIEAIEPLYTGEAVGMVLVVDQPVHPLAEEYVQETPHLSIFELPSYIPG